MIVAVVVTFYTAGALAHAAGGFLSVVGSGAAALGSGTATLSTALIAGAAGSIASQAVGLATGLQSKFDWSGVALAAISAGVNGGLASKLGAVGKGFIAGAVRGVEANVLTQGVALATGLQKRFDWTGVAVGGVVGGVSNYFANTSPLTADGAPTASVVGGLTGLGNAAEGSIGGVVNSAVTGVAGAIAGAATRSLITGTDFGKNILADLPTVIGATIGNAVGARLASVGPSRFIKRLVVFSGAPDDVISAADKILYSLNNLAGGDGQAQQRVAGSPELQKLLRSLADARVAQSYQGKSDPSAL